MSAVSINAEQIRKIPSLMGEADVLKSLQMLPGVQGGGEGRAGIFVRGGDYDQNLFMLDGITLYNPEHLQGFTSAINSDLMDDVVLYKGAFPSRFGSRLSSVIDIFLREGDMESFHKFLTDSFGDEAVSDLYAGFTDGSMVIKVAYYPNINSYMGRESIQLVMNDYSKNTP